MNLVTKKALVLQILAIRLVPQFSPAEYRLFQMVIAYTGLCIAAALYCNTLHRFDWLIYLSTAGYTFLTLLHASLLYFCFRVLWLKATIKPRPLFKDWLPVLTKGLFNRERLANAYPMFLIMFLLLTTFSNMKGLIAFFHPYTWDPFLADWDQKLHFDIAPWQWLQPLLGHTWITVIFAYLYNIWVFLLVFFIYWQLLTLKHPQLRLQFFFSFFFVWAGLGTLLAIPFASGGPWFYQQITGQDNFMPLMDYLVQTNQVARLGVLDAQNMLLGAYQKQQIIPGVGISALPSLHVAMAFLYFLVTRRINLNIGRFFGGYCLIILLGSVHLGWHYALDGYVSLIFTGVFWKLSGRWVCALENMRSDLPIKLDN